MKKKVIMICALGIGMVLLSGNSTRLLVQSSEINENISPETPEEAKSYYVGNKEQLFQEKKEKETYEAYCNTLKLQKCQYQEEYLAALQQELKTKIKIENEKLELGYTTEINVTELEVQLKETETALENLRAQKEYYKKIIQIYGGECKTIEVSPSVPTVRENYLEYFLDNNVQIKYYEYQIKDYQEYLDEYKEAENREDIKIQKELMELDKKAYEANLQVYVEGKILQYESVLRNITQINKEVKLLEEKIQASRELYEVGKIAEIKVIEMETEQKRLIYEQKSLMYDMECIQYILEHKIEGVDI